MRITAVMDSFKGSLSSIEAGNAVKIGAERVFPDAEVFVCPIADGGEGTVSALVPEQNIVTVTAVAPFGDKVSAKYGIRDNGTAVIEAAAASGITLVPKEKLNPLFATSYGTGELIRDAIERGCRKFIIGIGGSAVNDCGAGMLAALGFDLLDADGNNICLGARGLEKLAEIKSTNVVKELYDCQFFVACDVTNPLCGKNGASRIFGPQKGATEKMICDMDKWFMNFADITENFNGTDNRNAPGAGASGGMGFALMSFLGAEIKNGIDTIIKETGAENYIKQSDFVVTGEGRLDGQTGMGKTPVGIAETAKKYNAVVIGIAGCVTADARICNDKGIDAFFPIVKAPCTIDEALDREAAAKNLADTAEQVFRLIKSVRRD